MPRSFFDISIRIVFSKRSGKSVRTSFLTRRKINGFNNLLDILTNCSLELKLSLAIRANKPLNSGISMKKCDQISFIEFSIGVPVMMIL